MTVMLATFMEVLDTSVANVALQHIAGSLSAGHIGCILGRIGSQNGSPKW